MKKYSIGIFAIIIIFCVINFFQPFQIAKACNVWDPNYNFATGECDLQPSGQVEFFGSECHIVYFDEERMVWTWRSTDPPTYSRSCIWSVVGQCAPGPDCA